MGPFPLVTWQRGYACVSTGLGPKWIPGKNVKPCITLTKDPDEQETELRQTSAAWRRRKKKKPHPQLPLNNLQTKNLTVNFQSLLSVNIILFVPFSPIYFSHLLIDKERGDWGGGPFFMV